MKTRKIIIVLLAILLMIASSTPVMAASKGKLNKTSAKVVVGKTVKLNVKGISGNVKWSSSNKKVATVDKKGVVTGKKKGTAKITAKVGKKKFTCKITVKKNSWIAEGHPANISFWPANLAYCDSTDLIFAKARPYKLWYDRNGNLRGQIAVVNESIGINYYLTEETIIIRDPKTNKVIADGHFTYDMVIPPRSYGLLPLVFDYGGTKKIVDLTKMQIIRSSIMTN